jgi:hypothetical protein
MSRFLQFGILAAGLILILFLGFFRKSDPPAGLPVRANAGGRGSAPEEAGAAPTATPAPPKPADRSLESILASAASADRPPGVLSGPFKVEAPGEAPDGLGELGLTASQRAIVDALLAERDARLREIRQEVDARLPKGAGADRLCAAAERAQSTCMTSIRETLLPDQRPRFDALVKSGRWGGYLLVIPR